MTTLEEIKKLKERIRELEGRKPNDEEEAFSIMASKENAEKRLAFIYGKAEETLIPEKWRDIRLDVARTEAEKAALDFASSFPNERGLFFHGTTGTGKTYLSAAIANYILAKHHVPLIFKSYATILDDIRRNYEEDKLEIERICKVPLLIIDDIGQEKQTEWQAETTFKIINSRYETLSPVVLTTNSTIMELRDNLGEAVFSRLWEMCKWIKMNGKDQRMEG